MSVNGVILGMGLVLSIFQAARITVTRVDKDLYRIDDTRPARYLQTRYCHEYALAYGSEWSVSYRRKRKSDD